ncbi:phytanoyl-CoA dioxygenase family protein [Stieleria sp. ICT_E10.1]|uniref:phytanoyl-CoA dioxygenase family protein n=1 Tax=Stieleria sedimenti TaxID=2976331 RepID=UPI00217FAF57|nr:phytanoyl-CoA dioxygenase family protein [Stieleria sedimenti]MCS7467915.1 phytanoyl-CoA dioxygenase family protein [Stieleria sedimenti]
MRDQARTKTLGFSQGIVDYPTDQDREAEIAFPAKPGDLLVHDALTIHRADGNQSPTRSRRALGFIYYSNRARENVEAHAAYQRRLAEVEIARRIRAACANAFEMQSESGRVTIGSDVRCAAPASGTPLTEYTRRSTFDFSV